MEKKTPGINLHIDHITSTTKVVDAILCCIGFIIFSLFIHAKFPLRVISFVGLMLPAFIISKRIQSFSDVRKVLGEVRCSTLTISSICIGMVLGISFATVYRYNFGMPLFVTTMTSFAITAASIGAMEEVVFRGFIQGHLQDVNKAFSIVFGSFTHTTYKCALFLSPVLTAKVDIMFLMFWTFVCGILFGILKQYSKSILPPLMAHSLFDVLVYAQCVSAPWWVW